ncbi:laccase-7-like [Anneissia japonica]|uniref:laccase-7-like n=1 Tax=Anneissia japonica TaxID=1529436 RepID=UPI001425A691|nr:laccase-7-like [Anneissia japonica]
MAVDIRSVNNDRYHDPVYYPLERFGFEYRLEIAQMNEISFLLPPSPPLTQYDDLSEKQFCTKETTFRTKNCTAEYCECTQIIEVDLGDVVELIVVNEASIIPLSHSIHLHGYHFRFIGKGKIGDTTTVEEVKAMDKAGNLTRKLHGAVRKDTFVVDDGGYAIIRFHADNPGWWMFHCHLVTDFKLGMGVLIKVGEQSDLPEIPPNFPRCGSFNGQQRSEVDNIQDKPGSASAAFISIYVLLFLFICIKVL